MPTRRPALRCTTMLLCAGSPDDPESAVPQSCGRRVSAGPLATPGAHAHREPHPLKPQAQITLRELWPALRTRLARALCVRRPTTSESNVAIARHGALAQALVAQRTHSSRECSVAAESWSRR